MQKGKVCTYPQQEGSLNMLKVYPATEDNKNTEIPA